MTKQTGFARNLLQPPVQVWTPRGFISSEYFLNFLYIPPWLRKSFKFMVLRLLEDTFISHKI